MGIVLILPNTLAVLVGKRYCFFPLSMYATRKYFKFSKRGIRNPPLWPKLVPLYFSSKRPAIGFWRTILCLPFLLSLVSASNTGQAYNPQSVSFESKFVGDERISTADFEFDLIPVINAVTTISGYDQDGTPVFSADITVTDKTKSQYVCTYKYSGLANKRFTWNVHYKNSEFCVCESMKEPQCLIWENIQQWPTGVKIPRNKCSGHDFDDGMSIPDNLGILLLGSTELYSRCCEIGLLGRGQDTTLCAANPVLGTSHVDVFDCGQQQPTLGLNIIVRDAAGSIIVEEDFQTQEFQSFDSEQLQMTFDAAGYQPSPPGKIGVLMHGEDVKAVYAEMEAFGITNSAFAKSIGLPTEEGGNVLNFKADIFASDSACRFGQSEEFDPGKLDAQYQPLSTYMNCQVDFLTSTAEKNTVLRDLKLRNAPVTDNSGEFVVSVDYLQPQGTLTTHSCGGHITVRAKSTIANSFDADKHSLTADDITCSQCSGHWGTEQAKCICTTNTIGLLVVKPTDIYTIPLATVLDSSSTEFELLVVVGNPYAEYLLLEDGTSVKLPTEDLEAPSEYDPDDGEGNSVNPAVDPSIEDDFLKNLGKIILIIIAGVAIFAGVILVILLLCSLRRSKSANATLRLAG